MRSSARTNRRAPAGYTLLEVLLAIGIFVIGFVAVASIFPAAAMLQKATVMDVTEQEFARSMKAVINSVGTDAKITGAPINAVANGNVYDISAIVGPDDLAHPQLMFVGDTTPKRLYARIYARHNGSAWVFFTFLLRPLPSGLSPTVTSYTVTVTNSGMQTMLKDTTNTLLLAPGDAFMDDQGSTYYVSEFDSGTHTITIDGFPSSPPTKVYAANTAGLCKRIAVSTR